MTIKLAFTPIIYWSLILSIVFVQTVFCEHNEQQQPPVTAANHNVSSTIITKIPFHHSTHPSSLSSSSASSEDQLAPSQVDGLSRSSTTCVTCPQTVCTISKVSYIRKTIHHNWRVDGLPDYIIYLEKFQAPFEISSEVRFNTTPPNDGWWTFTLTRATNTHDKNASPVELHATYRYTTQLRSPPKISFDLWLSLHVEDEYVTLPSQISSRPTLLTEQQLYQLGQNSYTWTYLFLWSDIQSKLLSLIESHGLESQLVEFKFVINSYQEGDVTSVGTDCQDWNTEGNHGNQEHLQIQQKTQHMFHNTHGNYAVNPVNNATWPPFLHQMYTIMKDDKYTDLTIKSGDDEFQIHRVIAAYSSPILATMIYNRTYQKSESLLDLGEDIGSDVVEELIRYMYTGRVEDIDEIADRLLMAATSYGFPALKRQCEAVLIKQVKTENAFSMYELGVEVGSMRLKRRAFNVMRENKSKIVAQSEEFRKLSVHHPEVMYELFLS